MVTEKLSLVADNASVSQVIRAVQGENNARTFQFQIIDGTGEILDLSNSVVSLYVMKRDGTVVMIPGTVDGTTVSITLTLQAVASPGDNPCWLQITGQSYDLRVNHLVLRVKACNFDGAVESSSEFSALSELIIDTQAAIQNAETATTAANNAAETATNAAGTATTAAGTANSAASAANTAAGTANTAAGTANTAAGTATEAATAANSAASSATSAASAANTAADRANDIADNIDSHIASVAVQKSGDTMTGALNLNVPLAVASGGTGANTASGAFSNIVSPGGEITGALTMNNNVSVNSKLSDGTVANLIGRNTSNNLWIGTADDGAMQKQGDVFLATSADGNAYVSRNNVRDKILDYGFVGNLLWEGNWSSGTISIPETSQYKLFMMYVRTLADASMATPILGLKYRGTRIRGPGGYNSSATLYVVTVDITLSGNTWTFGECISNNFTNDTKTDLKIIEIYGIV